MGTSRIQRAIAALLQRVSLKGWSTPRTAFKQLNREQAKEPDGEKIRVFISYSRKDMGFVDRLNIALEARGIDTLIDREDIAKSEEWWSRIQQLIIEADTIIFALSPDSAVSKICEQEAEYAENLKKRLVPIVVRDLAAHPIPKPLARLNYIFFTPNPAVGATGDFDSAVNDVMAAIETNIGWIREHTRLGTLASRWQFLGRPHALELRGEELLRAEKWLSTHPKNAPEPNEAHRGFIEASRRLASRQHRYVVGGLCAGLVVLSTLTIYAFIRQQEAERQAALALTSSAKSNFRAKQQLPALIDSMKAITLLKRRVMPTTKSTLLRASLMLREAIYESREANRIEGANAQSSDILSVRYSPDGKMVASGDSGDSVVLWTDEGVVRQKLTFETQLILGLSFSPNGTEIAAIDRGNNVAIWSTINGKQQGSIYSSLTYSGPKIDLTPELRNQPRYRDAWIRLWGKAGEVARTSEATVDKILAKRDITVGYQPIKASPDGKFLAVGIGKSLEMWSIYGSFIKKLGAHDGEIVDVAISSDSTLIASGSKDGSIKVWTNEGNYLLDTDDPREEQESAVTALGFSQDGNLLLSLYRNDSGKVWDMSRIRLLRAAPLVHRFDWDAPDTEHAAVSIRPDGKSFAAGYASGQIKFWNIDTLQPSTLVESDNCSPFDNSIIRFSLNGKVLVSSGCRDVRLWNEHRKRKKKLVLQDDMQRPNVSFSRDSSMLLISIDGSDKSQIYDSNGRFLRELAASGFSTLSPDGKKIVFWNGDKLIWRDFTGKQVRTITPPNDQAKDCIGRLEFSHYGNKILAQGQKAACIIDPRDGSMRLIRPPGRAYITNTDISHDGTRVAIANLRNVVTIYDISRSRKMPVQTLIGHTGPVDSVRFGSDGSLVVTASSRDGSIRIWEGNGTLIHVIETGSAISAVGISPDDKSIIYASGNTLTALDLDVDVLLALGCKRLRSYLHNPNTNLGEEERRLCRR